MMVKFQNVMTDAQETTVHWNMTDFSVPPVAPTCQNFVEHMNSQKLNVKVGKKYHSLFDKLSIRSHGIMNEQHWINI